MVFGRQRAALADKIAPAVESVTNTATTIITLATVAVVVSVVALVVACGTRSAVRHG